MQAQVVDAHKVNVDSFEAGSSKPNEYCFMAFVGGSGAGKTRAAFEALRIIKEKCGERFGFKNIGGKIESISVGFTVKQIPPNLPSKDLSKGQRPPVDLLDVNAAVEALSAAIASTALVGNVNAATALARAAPAVKSFDGAVAALRAEKNLGDDDVLVLAVQLDEFQENPFGVLTLTRAIERWIESGRQQRWRTLLVPVLSGTGASDAVVTVSATNYRPRIIQCEPLGGVGKDYERRVATVHRMLLKRGFYATSPANLSAADVIKENAFLSALLEATGGVFSVIEFLAEALVGLRQYPRDVQAAMNIYDALRASISHRYGGRLVDYEESIPELLRSAVRGDRVTREYKLNGHTLGQMEKDLGLVHLENVQPGDFSGNGPFYVRLPLPLLATLHNVSARASSGINFFEDSLLDPFLQLNPASFPDFYVAALCAHLRLLATRRVTEISINDLFLGHAYGRPRTLATMVKVHRNVRRVTVVPNEDGRYPRVGAGTTWAMRTAIPVEFPPTESLPRTVDLTTGEYIGMPHKTSKSADALGPPPLDHQPKMIDDLSGGKVPMPHPARFPTNMDDPFYFFPSLVSKELAKIPKDSVLVVATPKMCLMRSRDDIPERVVLLDGRRLMRWLGGFASPFTFRRDPSLDDKDLPPIDMVPEKDQLTKRYEKWEIVERDIGGGKV